MLTIYLQHGSLKGFNTVNLSQFNDASSLECQVLEGPPTLVDCTRQPLVSAGVGTGGHQDTIVAVQILFVFPEPVRHFKKTVGSNKTFQIINK